MILVIIVVSVSCGPKKKKFSLNNYVNDDSVLMYDSEIRVPFKEEYGIKTVEVKINGVICTDMVFDSGCSGSTISLKEANYLASIGKITREDFKGEAQALIADGSIVDNMVFNIKSLVIGDKLECKNVEVTVSANEEAPLLLGNEVLNRVASYTVDNKSKEVVFILK
ncbi:MAG: retroviral-like aspartic protease family protein [Bacteroidales bacterium]|nr:retroviral-like aspartic protease family protein [Bacteroidales bacterium]